MTIGASNVTLSIKNASLSFGKFYSGTNKDDEISADTVDAIVITNGNNALVSSCGREDASAGTTGSFSLYDGMVKIGDYSWDCPWGSKTNTSTWAPANSTHYVTQVTGANLDSGALGNIAIQCVKI